MQKDAYARLAGRYDRWVEPTASKVRRLGLGLCPPREGISVLDVGCGTGTQLGLYSRPGCRLVGIDPSPAMLALAREKLGTAAELLSMDAARMTFADREFDLVSATFVLHEMDPEARSLVLRECRRVTKPGGQILLIDFHYGPYPFPKGWLYKAFVVWSEMGAGRRHFSNYRQFISTRGLDGLLETEHLCAAKKLVVDAGVAALHVISV
jgi:ubiquinone/menaquinone biosynthesis C-methylase UbiE